MSTQTLKLHLSNFDDRERRKIVGWKPGLQLLGVPVDWMQMARVNQVHRQGEPGK